MKSAELCSKPNKCMGVFLIDQCVIHKKISCISTRDGGQYFQASKGSNRKLHQYSKIIGITEKGIKTYQKAFSSGIISNNKPAKKFIACNNYTRIRKNGPKGGKKTHGLSCEENVLYKHIIQSKK